VAAAVWNSTPPRMAVHTLCPTGVRTPPQDLGLDQVARRQPLDREREHGVDGLAGVLQGGERQLSQPLDEYCTLACLIEEWAGRRPQLEAGHSEQPPRS
jgi:hypothetical protein